MAIEYFLKFGSIKGESQASQHKEEIELMSWSWGASNPTTIVGSGMSTGKVSLSDITCSKRVDKSSPKLLELLFTGKHVADATITCQKQTGDKKPQDYLTIKLKEVYVSSYQTGGSSGDDLGSESITLSYGSINYDYKMQQKDGSQVSAGNIEYSAFLREQTA
jgi:type VI secretion system secreted protein Hcp